MESQAQQPQEPSKARRPRREIASQEKVKAVLAIWTERRTASQVCREMSVNRMQVDRWEEQALEGMLHAFERRSMPSSSLTEPKALGSHLEKLLERSLPKGQEKLAKLQERLERLQSKGKEKERKSQQEKETKQQP